MNICDFLNYISRRVYRRCIDDFNAVNKMLQKVQKYVEYCENLEIVEGLGFLGDYGRLGPFLVNISGFVSDIRHWSLI